MKKILSREDGSRQTMEILKKYAFVLKKRFGQNFLIDPHVLDKILQAARIDRKSVV